MQSDHIPMTIDEFHRLPHRLGWKHEYWDGEAHITPGHAVVDASLPIEPRSDAAPCALRALRPDDEAALVAAFAASFVESVDYCDWEAGPFQESAERCIRSFCDGTRGTPLGASRVAVAPTDASGEGPLETPPAIVGAALIIRGEAAQARLDMLFVVPGWQRRGLASALVAAALAELHAAGFETLVSRYRLANAVSRAWHLRFGFTEEPDWFTTGHFRHHALVERHRLEEAGELSAVERAALDAELERWDARYDALEAAGATLSGLRPTHHR